MPEEGQGAIPSATPGWHVHLHAPLSRSGVWGGNSGVQYFGETHLGSTSGWDVSLGRTIPPGWLLQMGSPSTEGSDRIFPTPPVPPQHHPVFFYLSQAIISIIIVIFPPRLPSQHQPRSSVYRRDSANTKGEMSVCCITCFSPNVMWGYRISHHVTAAVPWLRSSPSSCCKPFLPGGPLPWILQTPDARILASKKSGFGLHLEPGS